jgi:hypothetical protein
MSYIELKINSSTYDSEMVVGGMPKQTNNNNKTRCRTLHSFLKQPHVGTITRSNLKLKNEDTLPKFDSCQIINYDTMDKFVSICTPQFLHF